MKRTRAYLLMAIYFTVIAAGGVALAHAVHAQALVDPSYAYTVADPVRDGAIGLVTTQGRFAVSRGDDCAASGIGAYQEVLYWRIENFTGLGSIGVVDDQGVMHLCTVRLEQLVDQTPCFEDAEGACDVALEFGG